MRVAAVRRRSCTRKSGSPIAGRARSKALVAACGSTGPSPFGLGNSHVLPPARALASVDGFFLLVRRVSGLARLSRCHGLSLPSEYVRLSALYMRNKEFGSDHATSAWTLPTCCKTGSGERISTPRSDRHRGTFPSGLHSALDRRRDRCGEAEERVGLGRSLAKVLRAWRDVAFQTMKTTAVSQTSSFIAPVFPIILCAPKYLDGSMSLGDLRRPAAPMPFRSWIYRALKRSTKLR